VGNWPISVYPIIGPFDILLHLGIDIFRDLIFDTWLSRLLCGNSFSVWTVPGDGVGDDNMKINHKVTRIMRGEATRIM